MNDHNILNYKIENINFFDIRSIELLGKECLPIYYTTSDLLFIIFDKQYILYKITVNNEIIGFLVALKKYNEYNQKNNNIQETNNVKRLHIMSIGIKDKYRKKGFGCKLINKLKDYIKENYNYNVKISLYVLTNNIGAIKLYEKCGLRRIFEDKNFFETLETKSAYYYES